MGLLALFFFFWSPRVFLLVNLLLYCCYNLSTLARHSVPHFMPYVLVPPNRPFSTPHACQCPPAVSINLHPHLDPIN